MALMNPLNIFALVLFGLGMFLVGISVGEKSIIRKDRAANHFRSQDDSEAAWMMGVTALAAAVVIAIVAANPAQKQIERARQLGSPMIDTR